MESKCAGALAAFTAHACMPQKSKALWLATLHLEYQDASPLAVIAAAGRARAEAVGALRRSASPCETAGDERGADRSALLRSLGASVAAHGRRSAYPVWVQALAAYLALACYGGGGMRDVCERNATLMLDAMGMLADAQELRTGRRPIGDDACAFARRLDTLVKPGPEATFTAWWGFVERIVAALWAVGVEAHSGV